MMSLLFEWRFDSLAIRVSVDQSKISFVANDILSSSSSVWMPFFHSFFLAPAR